MTLHRDVDARQGRYVLWSLVLRYGKWYGWRTATLLELIGLVCVSLRV